MEMSTILLVYCFIISCYVFSPNAAEYNNDLESYAMSKLVERMDAMERLARETSKREKVMIERIENLERMLSQSEILTKEIMTCQETMQREISELRKEVHNHKEKTEILAVALSDESRNENNDLRDPQEEKDASNKQVVTETSIYDINVKPKPIFLQHKRANAVPVAFSVYISHITSHLGIDQIINYDGVISNEGNAYNPITGIFTCPQDGLYLFAFFTATLNEHKTWVKLVVDGNAVSNAVSQGVRGGHDDQGGNVAILRLTAGQSVWTATFFGSDAELDGTSGFRHVTFSGVRLSD